ncbi:hypothetical protein BXO88_10760 [Oribacterium sp. C9]|uniref:hypothetical protein n=1 Tax=Oribacterium sp. C9 TaxID=1943579 RepID=UPI00098EB51C|nr:hypothetical protein [Oribacterium sp. C9]OON85732.1 hypothetical protein BXO88_10760 [Oribacterium sp. C9]
MKKKGCSCFVPKERGVLNPIRHVKRWCTNIKNAYQRIRYGYCDRDVWAIDWWFLNVVPNMLEDLKDTAHGYPDSPGDYSQVLIGTGFPEDVDEEGMKKWKGILSDMIFLLREANEDTCTKTNPYEEEYEKASKEFTDKYGFFGEGLKTEEDRAEEKEKGYHRMYMLSDVPEYKNISDLHYEEERKIAEYRDECKDRGMDLFKTWFWNLWD